MKEDGGSKAEALQPYFQSTSFAKMDTTSPTDSSAATYFKTEKLYLNTFSFLCFFKNCDVVHL